MFNHQSGYLNSADNRRISPKKKKRKYSVEAPVNNQFVANTSSKQPSANLNINIIDRVLDLNKYDKNTGMYTLCRDWINATTSISEQPNVASSSLGSDEEKIVIDQADGTITQLPNPISSELIEGTDRINDLNENIKNKIRLSEKNDLELLKSLNVNADDSVMQTHALLRIHVNRWRMVRKEWTNFYKDTNKPYQHSLNILKSIFEDN